MTDLRDRILPGSGPDRELDALVWCAFHEDRTPTIDGAHYAAWGDLKEAPPLTAYPVGVGHCIALKDEVLALAGWDFEQICWPSGKDSARAKYVTLGNHGSGDAYRSAEGVHEDLPRAILAALLDAKAQEAS